MRSTWVAIVAVVMMGTGIASGRTFVVSTGGNDGASGTVAAPWRTLAKANATLSAGDTVMVRGGTYHERIAPARSGADGSPIVYRAYPGETVEIDGANDTDLNLVALHGSWVVVENFTFRNQDYFDLPGRTDYWVVIEGHHNIFRYNRVIADGDVYQNLYTRNALSRAIVEAGKYNLIEHCFVRGLSFGIVIAGSSPRYTVIRYDTVYACGQNNIDVGSTADGTTAYHGTLIEYCILDTSIVEDNIQFEPDYGDPTTTLHNRGTIIRYNRMGNAAENAIDLKGAGHTIIEHNLIYSSSGDDDGSLGGHDNWSGGGVTSNSNTPTRNTIVRGNVIWDHSTGLDMAEGDHYFNNTLLNNRRTWQGPNQPGGTHAALMAYSYPNTKRAFLNNIVAGQSNVGIHYWMMDWGDKFNINSNLYYDQGAAAKFYHRMNGSLVTTQGVENWKSALATYGGYSYLKGKDAAALEANPGFINAPIYATGYDAAWNFTPATGSAAIDAGGSLTTTVGAGSNSSTLVVDDAYFFCDGFGIIDGDVIRIGSSAAVRIASINYTTNTLTLVEPRTWSNGAAVYMNFNGRAPDIGAMESGSGDVQPSAPAPAMPVSPADGSVDVALTSALTWNASTGALTYHVQVSLSSSFVSFAIDQPGILGTSFPLTSLAGGTTYYWRVRAANTGGFSTWSSPRSLTTAGSSGGSDKVGVELLTNPDFENGTNGWSFYTSGTGSFTASTPAYEGAAAATITTTSEGANIQLYQGGIELTAGAYYRLTFAAYSSTGHDMALGLMQHGAPYTNYGLWTRTVPLSTEWRTYTVYIRARNFTGSVNDARLQVWFPAFAKAGDIFHIDGMSLQEIATPAVPASPQLVHPLSGGTDQLRLLTLDWTSSDGADDYRVQVARDPLFAQLVCDSVVTDTTVQIGPLDASTLYYHRIQAMNVMGGSSYAAGYFMTGVTKTMDVSPDVLPGKIGLDQNYPNPFNPATMIRYRLNAESHVSLSVHNVLGAEVAVLVDEDIPAGEHAVSFDGASLASGTYFYTLRAGRIVETRRMVLVR